MQPLELAQDLEVVPPHYLPEMEQLLFWVELHSLLLDNLSEDNWLSLDSIVKRHHLLKLH